MDAQFIDRQAYNLHKAIGGALGPAVVLQTPEQIKEALAAVMSSVTKPVAGQVVEVRWSAGDWLFGGAAHRIVVTGLSPEGFATLNGAAQTGSF